MYVELTTRLTFILIQQIEKKAEHFGKRNCVFGVSCYFFVRIQL